MAEFVDRGEDGSNVATTGPLHDFVDVKRVQANLLSDLGRLREYSKKLGLDHSIRPIDDAVEHLQNDTFSIAVVGEFKRGKSTFINALLGRDVLPMDMLPTTATLSRVVYGLKPEVTIHYKDGRQEDVDVDQLEAYVTKLTDESQKLASTVGEAVVRYPVPYLRSSVEIIDTPGLNDDESMTAVTRAVVPHVDAAILVIVPESPFSQYEAEFLEHQLLTSDLAKVIFVVNRIDTLDEPEDVERIVAFVQQRVQTSILERAAQLYGADSEELKSYSRKIGVPKVFGVASKPALRAKMTNDVASLEASRFPLFEAALERFLTEERGPILIQVPLNRVRRSAQELLDVMTLRQTSLELKRDEFLAAYENSTRELMQLRERKSLELKRIDAAAAQMGVRVKPLIDQLPGDLLSSVDQAIDQAPISVDDLRTDKQLAETNARLMAVAADSITDVTRLFAERVEIEIKKGLEEEATRLRDFGYAVEQVLGGISAQFDRIEASTKHQRQRFAQGAIFAATVLTGWGGLLAGYRQAGWRGAALGTGTSIGIVAGAGMLLAAVAFPLTVPIAAVIGIVSFLAGGGAVRRLMGDRLVENFRVNYKTELHNEIETHLAEQEVEAKVSSQITILFDALKSAINDEVEAVLENTHHTLADLRAKRERNETLTERDRQELTDMREHVQRIAGNAQRLAEHIVPIESI